MIVGLVVLLAVAGGAVWYFMSKSSIETSAPVPSPVSMVSNDLVVNDQYPGSVVHVTSANFKRGGWVVIEKSDNGAPGAIIGEAYFGAGLTPGDVQLSEPTVEGGHYFAAARDDDGDKKFDPAKDVPILQGNGSPLVVDFMATTNLPESKG